MRWTGHSFEPMLQPSDYRHYIRPGMKMPWTPALGAIQWEKEDVADTGEGEREDLRKRETAFGDSDIA